MTFPTLLLAGREAIGFPFRLTPPGTEKGQPPMTVPFLGPPIPALDSLSINSSKRKCWSAALRATIGGVSEGLAVREQVKGT
jgi:hypothetical protein